MKEPLPEARALIERAWLENNTEHDHAFPKAVAISFGAVATALVLCGAELFGPAGALAAMLLNVAAIAIVSKKGAGRESAAESPA